MKPKHKAVKQLKKFKSAWCWNDKKDDYRCENCIFADGDYCRVSMFVKRYEKEKHEKY